MCVLVVEDEPFIRDLLAEVLREAGYDVMEVEDGPSALALAVARTRHFTGLVTDLHMPGGVDRLQVAEGFRKAFPAIPVIIVSGRPDVLDPRWSRKFNYQVVRKPFLLSQLVKQLRSFLDPRSSHDTHHSPP